ncbi:hypothetical protein EVAR_1000_1 [Eumeta japonica]|uniref:Endonuclease/exonuclease/phosphatase domain-containing protein n=1 Tax=Eumeta variegata TaxID=151549 RepID=A0A4C1SEC6_EUMVA|nr:hypothetical protein EVAR_1000_1 [Eumeta japonica]
MFTSSLPRIESRNLFISAHLSKQFSIYIPSSKKLLRRYLIALLALGDAAILFGDFNCKNPRWDYPIFNYNGNKLIQLEDRLNFEPIAPSTSIYYPDITTIGPPP